MKKKTSPQADGGAISRELILSLRTIQQSAYLKSEKQNKNKFQSHHCRFYVRLSNKERSSVNEV